MRVIVTGGRERADFHTIWADLDARVPARGGELVVRHGANPRGADKHAHDWYEGFTAHYENQGITIVEDPYPAAWDKLGAKAGPARNAEMVKAGADEVLAYPDATSTGTWGCVQLADWAHIPVTIRRLPDDPPRGIQRSRKAGVRLRGGTICVDRTTPWGNPFTLREANDAGHDQPAQWCVDRYQAWVDGDPDLTDVQIVGDRTFDRRWVLEHLATLHGRDLACFCPVGSPCHRDVLLDLVREAS